MPSGIRPFCAPRARFSRGNHNPKRWRIPNGEVFCGWTFGLQFAYNDVTAHGGKPRRKTMASKKPTKKLKKGKKVEHTKNLTVALASRESAGTAPLS
jgi:hypothetical protein